MTRDDVNRMAREAGCRDFMSADGFFLVGEEELERFAELAIADFLQRAGQYVTNEATRAAVVAEALAAERESCAQVCEEQFSYGALELADFIRARGAT